MLRPEESSLKGIQGPPAPRFEFIRTKRSQDTESVGKKAQLDRAIRSLQQYNPNFQLTAEVVEIIRLFFDELNGEQRGWIIFDDILRELEQLDPKNELVTQDIRHMMHVKWNQVARSTGESLDSTDNSTNDEALDFEAFCTWVMLVREISPSLWRTVYTSWAKEIAIVDFGLPQEEDGLFVLRSPVDAVLSSHHPTSGLFATITGRIPGGDRRITPHKSPLGDLATDSLNVDHNDSSRLHVADSRHANSEAEVASNETYPLKNNSAIITMSKSFIAGGSAGIIAKSVLAPADRVKIIFQVSEDTKFTFRNAFNLGKNIYTQDGFRALFRGNLLNIMRVVPYAGLQHSSFDLFRRQFHAHNTKHLGVRSDSKLSNYQLVAAGSLSGGVSLMIAYPLDIIRARYTVQQGKNQFGSIMEAVRAMYKADGLRSFTRGMVPSLLGTLPYTGIGFSLNEKFKTWVHDFQSKGRKDPQPPLHPIYKFACSYVAACVAQTCTYPLDTIRRRIQTDGYLYSTPQRQQARYTGVITSARIIMQREGWRGFFKGVSVNWLRSPLATGISLTAYDLLKEVMGVEKVALNLKVVEKRLIPTCRGRSIANLDFGRLQICILQVPSGAIQVLKAFRNVTSRVHHGDKYILMLLV
uniref:Mitochondrial Carrier (MC) Family putative n=1 Tax=Albugo laibachii Nc14 TaxID=890382 RepID=F0WJ16_9STRA|nr:Mitochondrial Carrier (MC) Family putative [Albugo laibachii Nc14]|eukprot:CCA21262.1 Mitochondrial Carrier (MC) Family putative [Albugo laibachii Nc14]